MSSGIGLTIQSSELQKLAAIADQLAGVAGSTELFAREGEILQETVRAHFEKLAGDSAHHKTASALGAERTGFYEEAAERVQAPVTEGAEGVSVSVEHEGLAQRYFGGEIHGNPFLTIPARAEAYGHRAREFENLQLIIFPSGAGALIAKGEGTTQRGGRGGKGRGISQFDSKGSEVFYWLVRQVHQEADPTVLPGDDEILNPAIEAAAAYVDILTQRAAA